MAEIKTLLPEKLSERYIIEAENQKAVFFVELKIDFSNNSFTIEPSQEDILSFSTQMDIDQNKIMQELKKKAIDYGSERLNSVICKDNTTNKA